VGEWWKTPQKLDLPQVDLCLTIALEQSKRAMAKPTRQGSTCITGKGFNKV